MPEHEARKAQQALRRSRARRLGRALKRGLEKAGGLADPALRLALADRRTATIWARNVRALGLALGGESSRGYGALLVAATAWDPQVARELAAVLPDQLARLRDDERGRYLKAMQWTLGERLQGALQVARNLPQVLPDLDDEALRRFIAQGAELVPSSPAKAASFLRGESGSGRQALGDLRPGISLEEVRRVLALYAEAHCGQEVRVAALGAQQGAGPSTLARGSAAQAFADGHRIHLPPRVEIFGDARDFLVYRVSTALAVAYMEFGSFELDTEALGGRWPQRRRGESELQRLFRAMGNRSLARDLFQVIEDARVEAAVRRVYPGLARDLDRLRAELPCQRPRLQELSAVDQLVELLARRAWGMSPQGERDAARRSAWELHRELGAALESLRSPDASVQDSAALLRETWPAVEGLMRRAEARPGPREGRGRARKGRGSREEQGRAAKGMEERGEVPGARNGLQAWLAGGQLRPELRNGEQEQLDERAYAERSAARERGEELSFAQARRRVRKQADYEEMDAWLTQLEGPGGALAESEGSEPSLRPLPKVLAEGVEPERLAAPGAFTYPEWDATIEDSKPSWVLLREYPLQRGSRAFVDEVMNRHRALILSLRRQFEALRPEEMERRRALPFGDALDLDRVVEAYTVRRAGGSPSDRLYTRHERNRRDVAVAFLLDMSSSTNEVVSGDSKRIIEVEKEALVLIAEAVQAIGDAFAIYGFSGYGRDQVAFYVAKAFDQPYDDAARERIGAMSWKMENRDGAAIRHASGKLLRQPSRIKLLVLLSDGKPLDCGCDQYSDRYAQEDTRQALLEARKEGIHPILHHGGSP